MRRVCVVPRCTRPPGPHKRMCNTCHDRVWRERFPEHHLWNNLKKSAKKRGLPFTISLSWWVAFCEMTGFAEMVGRGKGFASIDRIENWRGYEPDNIRVLEFGANSAKHQHEALASDPDDGHDPF